MSAIVLETIAAVVGGREGVARAENGETDGEETGEDGDGNEGEAEVVAAVLLCSALGDRWARAPIGRWRGAGCVE